MRSSTTSSSSAASSSTADQQKNNLRRFIPAQIGLTDRVTVVGESGSGKSEFFKSFLFARRNEIKKMIVFSGSEAGNGQWAKHCSRPFIYEKFSEEALNRIIETQTELTNNPPPGVDTKCIIAFDDMDAEELRTSPAFKVLFTRSRHWGCGIWVLVQQCTMIPPIARTNSNVVAVTNTEGEERSNFYKYFFKVFGNEKLFNRIMDAYCANYGMLVYLKQAKSSQVSDKVFWAKCDIIKEAWTVGGREYWAMEELFALSVEQKKRDWTKYREQLRNSEVSLTMTPAVKSIFKRLDEDGNPI